MERFINSEIFGYFTDFSFVTFDVKYEDIIKFFIHFGKAMSVIFFYMSARTGTMDT